MSYPRILAPKKKPDGKYLVVVERTAKDRKDLTYPDAAAAQAAFDGLQAAWALLEPTSNPVVRGVRGPHKNGDHWTVRWTEDGERRTFSHLEKSVVQAKASGLRPTPERIGLKAIPRKFTGQATEFRAIISDALRCANKAARSGDALVQNALRPYIANVKELATAIVPHSGHIETEEELARMVSFVEALYAGKETMDAEKPAIRRSLTKTLAGRSRPN